MARSTITAKGQTTVPISIRKRLGVNAGDESEFVVLDNGTVVVQPEYLDVLSLAGCLRRKGRKMVSISAMKEAVRQRSRRSA